jgi:predicted nucleic acid-binding Zn finger protein
MSGEDKDSAYKICEEAAKILVEKGVTKECEEKLTRAFGERGRRALKTVALKRVKKYVLHPSKRVRWIIVGRGEEYLVIPPVKYCSCKDFFFYVMTGEAYMCYHLLAQKIAELSGLFSEVKESDNVYERVIASRIFIG